MVSLVWVPQQGHARVWIHGLARWPLKYVMVEAQRILLKSDRGDGTTQGSVKNQFSFCLGNNGGVLVLGGTDVSLYNGLLKYSPLVSRTAYLLEATVGESCPADGMSSVLTRLHPLGIRYGW